MLVAENGDGAPGRAKGVHYLLKEPVPGLQLLALVVAGVIAMFADQEHRIYAKLA
jgi:hypothetical protein